jgi:ABC-type nickel/cobalt efflux system permease component RcnA
MTNGNAIAIIVLVAGMAIVLVSALADIVGLGESPSVLGYKQIAGIAAGAIVVAVGAVLVWRSGRKTR